MCSSSVLAGGGANYWDRGEKNKTKTTVNWNEETIHWIMIQLGYFWNGMSVTGLELLLTLHTAPQSKDWFNPKLTNSTKSCVWKSRSYLSFSQNRRWSCVSIEAVIQSSKQSLALAPIHFKVEVCLWDTAFTITWRGPLTWAKCPVSHKKSSQVDPYCRHIHIQCALCTERWNNVSSGPKVQDTCITYTVLTGLK